jgi:MoaA/NifB/PqqE/SkfB family radical SAM enzyme
MNIFDPLPEHRTLSIMPTFQCTAQCAHCGTLSSPREKIRLPLEYMLSAIDQAADAGYGVVVFTGGEPTLAGRNLITAIERAASHGLMVRMVPMPTGRLTTRSRAAASENSCVLD